MLKKKNKVSMDSMQSGVHMVVVADSKSVVSEQIKTIRTNIQFSKADSQLKTLVFTSSSMSEGKSTVAANVAASFANQGLRTLLVDADMRRPTVNVTFKFATTSQGLTNYLTDKDFKLSNGVYETSVKNLFVMPSGPVPPNPAELINSKRMSYLIHTLSEQLDLVIFDAPPVLSVTDAQVLSSKVDGAILVVRENYSEKEAVRRSVELLRHVKASILGTIINDADFDKDSGYYGYYGYYKK